MALEVLGRGQEAAQAYHSAISLAPEREDILLRLGKQMIALGFPRLVLLLVNEYDRTSSDSVFLKVSAQQALGDWAGATKTLKNLAQQLPKETSIWRSLALSAARNRDYPLAISAYKNSIEHKNPIENSEPSAAELLALADLRYQAREPEQAEQDCRRALKLDPVNPETNLLLAKCLRLQGDKSQSDEFLDACLKSNPLCGEAWQLKLEKEAQETLTEQAEQCLNLFEQEEAAPRDTCLAFLACGKAFETMGDYRQAFSCMRKGNAAHHAQMQASGKLYEPEATEESFQHMAEIFTGIDSSSRSNASAPIFILGMPRSGTTLVERILGEHQSIDSLGENEAIEFLAAQFYWDIDESKKISPDALTADYWQRLASQYWQRSNCEPGLVTDKMPHNFRHVGLILAMFPKAPIVHLKRDPRDVCLSIYSRMFPDGHRYGTDLQSIAHYYHQANQLMERWRAQYPGRIYSLQYEQLIAEPELECSRLFEFCNLDWREEYLEFHKTQNASFTFSELQVRKPLNSEGIARWRNYEDDLQDLISSLRIYGEI